jgi:hypothetical protein
MYKASAFVFWVTLGLSLITLLTVSYVGVYLTYIALPVIVVSGLIMKFSRPRAEQTGAFENAAKAFSNGLHVFGSAIEQAASDAEKASAKMRADAEKKRTDADARRSTSHSGTSPR